jgi:hypothetical protein
MKIDCLFVIRSAGERTEDLCKKLILRQGIPEEQVMVVREVPFSRAIQESFALGIKSGKTWLFCIDADVLISADGFRKILAKLSRIGKSVFCLEGLILDKFFSVLRPAGNHIYRISFVKKALSLIPKEGVSLRPESSMLEAMALIGYPSKQCDVVVGIHDYEQYYSDIYRKCFLQSHKHRQHISRLEKYWTDNCLTDPDFKVALWGLMSGKTYTDTVLVDKRFLETSANQMLQLKGTQEKSALIVDFDVDSVISNYFDAGVNDFQEQMFPESMWNVLYDKIYFDRRNSHLYLKKQWKTGIPFQVIRKLGSTLIKVGQWLHTVASNR